MLDWTQREVKLSDDKSIQGSRAWLEWRGKGLGSSDASVLLGWSPWKTIDQLWNEKLGRWIQEFGPAQTSAMERGKRLEPEIRKWCEGHLGHKFPDDVMEHSIYKFLRASFDGINREYKNPDGSQGRILEIKAPNLKDHSDAKIGVVPSKYEPQVQWLMLVGDIPWAFYVSFGSDATYAVVPVKADAVMQTELMIRAQVFWEHLVLKTKPSESFFKKWIAPSTDDPSGDLAIEEQTTENLVTEALKIQVELATLESKFDSLKDKLKSKLGDKEKMQCGEALFGWQTRKGAVDYGAIPELKLMDLEQFRKKDVLAFYFRRLK